MTRLLWKEFREQAVWGLLWAMSLIGLGTLAHAQSFCGMDISSIGLTVFVPLISAIVGAGAYSSELTGNRADFVCTRPIPWRRLLLAKMLFAAIVVVCSAAISSIVLRIVTPEPYLHFATPSNMLQGAVPLMIAAWIAYLAGMCFSVTLPGVGGGVIALMASALTLIIVGISSADVKGEHGIIYFWLVTGGLMGAASGAVVIIRSRLTLPTRERTIRFARIFMAWLAVMWVVRLVTPNDIISSRVPDAYQQAVFSPDARYAFMSVGRSESIIWSLIPGGVDNTDEDYYKPTRAYLVRLSDRRLGELPKEVLGHAYWMSQDTLAYSSGNALHKIRMRPDGAIEDQLQEISVAEPARPRLRPNATGLLIHPR